ncbi:MAG: hypothetical protein WCT18_01745 [Patescibacteria group bacterium]
MSNETMPDSQKDQRQLDKLLAGFQKIYGSMKSFMASAEKARVDALNELQEHNPEAAKKLEEQWLNEMSHFEV